MLAGRPDTWGTCFRTFLLLTSHFRSLYTSLIPPLALSGVGNMVAMSPTLKYKFLLLNGSYDRESDGLTAVDFVSTGSDQLDQRQAGES
jgi:2-phospho-L-lactate transferase/gluconeogenesis factor (CofD/UPF0052 family)